MTRMIDRRSIKQRRFSAARGWGIAAVVLTLITIWADVIIEFPQELEEAIIGTVVVCLLVSLVYLLAAVD